MGKQPLASLAQVVGQQQHGIESLNAESARETQRTVDGHEPVSSASSCCCARAADSA